jgi:hypothetical protein
MDQCLKVRLDQGEKKSVNTGRGVRERYLFIIDFAITQ